MFDLQRTFALELLKDRCDRTTWHVFFLSPRAFSIAIVTWITEMSCPKTEPNGDTATEPALELEEVPSVLCAILLGIPVTSPANELRCVEITCIGLSLCYHYNPSSDCIIPFALGHDYGPDSMVVQDWNSLRAGRWMGERVSDYSPDSGGVGLEFVTKQE